MTNTKKKILVGGGPNLQHGKKRMMGTQTRKKISNTQTVESQTPKTQTVGNNQTVKTQLVESETTKPENVSSDTGFKMVKSNLKYNPFYKTNDEIVNPIKIEYDSSMAYVHHKLFEMIDENPSQNISEEMINALMEQRPKQEKTKLSPEQIKEQSMLFRDFCDF